MKIIVCVAFLATAALSLPISQPVFPGSQYIAGQQTVEPLKSQPYLSHFTYTSGAQYEAAPQQQYPTTVLGGRPRAPPPPQPPPVIPRPYPNQLYIPTAVDRQVSTTFTNFRNTYMSNLK